MIGYPRMSCGRTRRLLWPDAGPRKATPEMDAAHAHLNGCPACREALAALTETADLVRDLAPRPSTPRSVRERMFTALAHERLDSPHGPRRRTLRWVRGLAVGVVAVGTLWLATGDVIRPSIGRLDLLAEDHVRGLIQESIVASEPATVGRWLAGRVPFVVHVPELPGAVLEGARLCLLDGRRGAVLEYRVAGKPISYYVMPGDLDARAPGDLPEFVRHADSGYAVVAWEDAGLVHALVGDLPEGRLEELARVCSQQRSEAG